MKRTLGLARHWRLTLKHRLGFGKPNQSFAHTRLKKLDSSGFSAKRRSMLVKVAIESGRISAAIITEAARRNWTTKPFESLAKRALLNYLRAISGGIMQLFIQFPDFSNTAAIDKYIEKRLKGIHRRLDARYENATITLRGAVLNRRSNGTPKSFEAELLVKLPKSKNPLVVKKKNKDFRTALSDAADAMETILQRDNEKAGRTRKTLGKSLYPIRKVKRSASLSKS